MRAFGFRKTPKKSDKDTSFEDLQKKTEELQARKYEAEIKEIQRESRNRTQIFDFETLRRNTKRRAAVIFIVLLVISPVIVFFFLSSTSHQGPFAYNLEAYYTSVFAPVSSLISPLFGIVTSQLACIGNPVVCVGQQTTNITVVVYPTFTSFVTVTPASSIQTVFLTGNDTPANLFYTVSNNANVPLGASTNNALFLNESCGSTDNPAEAHICVVTTSPKVILSNASFSSVLLSKQTLTNETKMSVSCPSKSSNIALPTLSSLILNFTIKNYSAGSILPVQFVSQQFSQQLLASSQPLEPNLPSVSFVSPGPLQIVMSVVEPMPIITGTGNIPITITVKNNGVGANAYKVNSLSIFLPKSMWPTSPQGSGWKCVSSTSSIKMQFAIPGSSYWVCTNTESTQQLQSAGTQFVLPQITSLSSLHFNTVPIFAYMNYNYYEYMNMPYKISASGSVCG
jgi:hypothetical protein